MGIASLGLEEMLREEALQSLQGEMAATYSSIVLVEENSISCELRSCRRTALADQSAWSTTFGSTRDARQGGKPARSRRDERNGADDGTSVAASVGRTSNSSEAIRRFNADAEHSHEWQHSEPAMR
jgi:hypothetical protein